MLDNKIIYYDNIPINYKKNIQKSINNLINLLNYPT